MFLQKRHEATNDVSVKEGASLRMGHLFTDKAPVYETNISLKNTALFTKQISLKKQQLLYETNTAPKNTALFTKQISLKKQQLLYETNTAPKNTALFTKQTPLKKQQLLYETNISPKFPILLPKNLPKSPQMLYDSHMETTDFLNAPFTEALLERFISYAKIDTESNSQKADQGLQPSSEGQWNLAKILNEELKALGLENVETSEHCYTYGFLKASPSFENIQPFCLLAHIDTVEEVTGKNVEPLVHKNYSGEKIKLPFGNTLDPSHDKELFLAGQEGDTIITSTGHTLLGADDKAGVAEIITMLEYFSKNPSVKHGPIEVVFSPDEETGHGMDNIPLKLIKSKFAYTVDGGHIGEFEKECFNAFKADVIFKGKSKHTGSARPDMVNAVNIACAFVANLPRHEMPETTDAYQGFICPIKIEGGMEETKVSLIVRDFEMDKMNDRLEQIKNLAKIQADLFGGQAEISFEEQYRNMKNGIEQNPLVIEKLISAAKKVGLNVKFTPIRGGTDGSRLTEMGIATPNIFTGGHNFHSRSEWASLSQMVAATQVLIQLAKVDS